MRLRQPKQAITEAFGSDYAAATDFQPVEEDVRIAVIIFIAGDEWRFLIGLVVYLIAKIPENVRYGLPAFEQEGGAGHTVVEILHIPPPRL